MKEKGNAIKSALKKLGNTVTLITSEYKGEKDVTTIAWISRISNVPPLVMISISPERYIHQLISDSNEFNVAIISEESMDLAINCGTKTGYNLDKFKEYDIEFEKGNIVSAPILKGALVNLECKVTESRVAGDHTIFIGEVISAHETKEGKQVILTDKLSALA